MNKIIFFIFLLISCISTTSAQSEILGKWLVQDEDAIIEIYEKGGNYFGKVIELMPATDEHGKPFLDTNNPDPRKRTTPIKGLNTILDFTWDGEALVGGTLYDPKRGKEFDGKIWIEGKNLKVKGSWAFFSQTETWNRK